MKTIQLTKGQVTIVDDVDYEFLSQWEWYAKRHRNCFRAARKLPGENGKQKTLYMYTAIAKRMGIDTKRIDHKDQNPLNNQRSNLRAATVSQNGHNRGAPSNSKTGVKGVSLHTTSGKYVAYISLHGKRYHLGSFNTVAEAKQVVVAKRAKLIGEFATA